MCCLTWAAARSQQLLFVVLAAGLWEFGVSLRDATSNLPSSPDPLSNWSVLHDGRKHKTVVSSQPNALREEACRTNLPLFRYRLPCRLFRWASNITFQRHERPFSRAVVIKTKSLPVSATMFPTALSLYFAHDRRKFSEQAEKRFRKSSGLRTILEGHFQVGGPVKCPMS